MNSNLSNYSTKNNNKNIEFDWYKLSLIAKSQYQPNNNLTSSYNPKQNFSQTIQKFKQILQSGNITKNLDKVPISYRKNLLKLFQTFSFKLKSQTKFILQGKQSLIFTKNAIAQKIQTMQHQLQQSKTQLVKMKSLLNQKRKISKKIKQKIQKTKQKQKQQQKKQTYFCPYCNRNNFQSKELFTFHMFSQHNQINNLSKIINNEGYINNNSSTSSAANNQLKDFILTLKDKQMEIIKMILQQKKNLETQQLQRLYSNQMNNYTMKLKNTQNLLTRQKGNSLYNGFYSNENNQDQINDSQQLKGQSQFLFYQKSQLYKKQIQKAQKKQFIHSHANRNPQQVQEYSIRRQIEEKRKKQLSKHPYYDIFKDLQQNKSQNYYDLQKVINNNSKMVSNTKSYNINNKESNINIYNNINDKQEYKLLISNEKNNFYQYSHQQSQNTEQLSPIQPLRMTSTNKLKFQQFQSLNIIKPSITDRLKQQQSKNQSRHNNTIYSNLSGMKYQMNNTLINQEGAQNYVFKCGPLIDDMNGDSDEDDYFGKNASKKRNQNQINSQNKRKINQNQINSIRPLKSNNLQSKISQKQQQYNQQQNQAQVSIIQDQQIKLTPTNKNVSLLYHNQSLNYSSRNHMDNSNQQIQISQLLSPLKQQEYKNYIQRVQYQQNLKSNQKQKQNNSFFNFNNFNSHEKSSQIVDLSDSFSRRDISISKDQETINLSDLKLSKLERKKAQEQSKIKESSNNIENNSNVYNQNQNQNKFYQPKYRNQNKAQYISHYQKPNTNISSINRQFFKKNHFIVVNQQKRQNQPRVSVLSEFQRKIQNPSPLNPYIYNFDKKQTYQLNNFYKDSPVSISLQKQKQKVNKLASNQKQIEKDEQKNQKVISPQDFFANQMRNLMAISQKNIRNEDKIIDKNFNKKASQNERQLNSFIKAPNYKHEKFNKQFQLQKQKYSNIQQMNEQLEPKIQFSKYQRDQPIHMNYLMNQIQYQRSNQKIEQNNYYNRFNQNQISNLNNTNKSSSKGRPLKKMQRIQQFQGQGQNTKGILNGYFKKQFSQENKINYQQPKIISQEEKINILEEFIK